MHPAVLLLLRLSSLLHALRSAAAFASNETASTASCAPARCGNLNISYPFTLGGVQPQECGFPAFELACDADRAYLTKSFRERLYRVYSISYDTNSLVVAVETVFPGAGMSCGVPDFNVSSGLALYPLNISNTNNNLVLLYNCEIPPEKQLFPPCANHTIGAYVSETTPEGEVNPPQWVQKNCSSVSVPVRALQEGQDPARNYMGLITQGFLLEWPAKESRGCDACRVRGGECRFVQFSLRCICPDGRPCPTPRGKQRVFPRVALT
ncbi:hypothetical protein PR202_ga23547 [Eleusine coracana subsp. coracana]|uniref:Wall-associated receptor kinase galacturonan-binding domain-containing protein n=1 Tax=Eleusine coracana subsp. coracana TaxID=191504 RepID=A0AAV5D6Y6_ELECO|nr:hypothetical protein PR202_ga23547 [Eleusine coracana subsp. coracana]